MPLSFKFPHFRIAKGEGGEDKGLGEGGEDKGLGEDGDVGEGGE